MRLDKRKLITQMVSSIVLIIGVIFSFSFLQYVWIKTLGIPSELWTLKILFILLFGSMVVCFTLFTLLIPSLSSSMGYVMKNFKKVYGGKNGA